MSDSNFSYERVDSASNEELLGRAAELLDKEKNISAAAELFNVVYQREPSNIKAMMGLVRIYTALSRFDDAMQLCDKVIGIDRYDQEAWFNKGDIFCMTGKMDKGEEAFRFVLSNNPNCSPALNSLGKLLSIKPFPAGKGYYKSYFSRKYIDEAVECFEKAIDADPTYSISYFNLALAFRDITCLEEAKYNFLRYLYFNPEQPMAWYHLSIIEERLGNINNAIFANRVFILKAESYTGGEYDHLLQQAYTRSDVLAGSFYKNTPFLNKFGIDLTRRAALGFFDNLSGRAAELVQLSQCLSSGIKNDVIIVGGPGVGKTALVNELASDIIYNDLFHVLSGSRIIELNFGLILADPAALANLIDIFAEEIGRASCRERV